MIIEKKERKAKLPFLLYSRINSLKLEIISYSCLMSGIILDASEILRERAENSFTRNALDL